MLAICLISGLCPARLLAQTDYSYHVSYEMLLNLDGPRRYAADLYIAASGGLFVFGLDSNQQQSGLIARDSTEASFGFEMLDTVRYSIFSDRQTQRILHLEQIPGSGNLCVVSEPLGTIEWQYTGQFRRIQELPCWEAKGRFMGRNYTVWFTDSIPAFFGPWKLHGLPGLVLEASDDSQEVMFLARSVRSVAAGTKPYDPMATGSFEVLDRHEYIRHFKDYLEKLQKRMMTKFGRGYQVKVQSSPIKTIEIYDQ